MNTIESLDLKARIGRSLVETFGTLLSLEIQPADPEPPPGSGVQRMVGTLDFAGQLTGTINLQVTLDFGRVMAAARHGREPAADDADREVRDLIAEITTIVGGHLTSALNDAGYACVLSTPSIANGTDFTIRSLGMDRFERLAYRHADHLLVAEVGLKKVAEADSRLDSGSPGTPGRAPAAEGEASPAPSAPEDLGLEILLDIPMELTVELGRTKIPIRELLKLNPGSAVKLAKFEGEPVDILADDVLIARGEVVVRKEKYGIRVTEITSRLDRLKGLR